MSGFRRVDIIEPSSSSLRFRETYIFNPRTLIFPSFLEEDELDFPFCGVLNPRPTSFELSTQCFFPPAPTTPVDVFDSVTDLIHVEKTPILSSYKKIVQNRNATTDFYLRSLSDRVSALELGFDRVLGSKIREQDRKYSWIAEIKTSEKDGVDRKYKWTAEIKGAKKDDEAAAAAAGVEKNYKWIAEIKGKGKDAPISRTYTFKASTAPAVKKSKESGKTKEKKEEKEEKKCCGTRAVAIEADDQGAIFLKQAFAKRTGAAAKAKGKKKELSPQDAAMMIQVTFRAYLIRRSQALRALRELAVAKTKLKELRVLFNNFSYRRRLFRDAEERQKFSERIIVLLLTVDAIEGVDLMVRVAKKSMVDELEAMLDVVDPQPSGKLGSMKRRKFDLPEGVIQQEIAAGVAEVVQMLDEDKNTFEVCL